jgi:hypothetical protein
MPAKTATKTTVKKIRNQRRLIARIEKTLNDDRRASTSGHLVGYLWQIKEPQ